MGKEIIRRSQPDDLAALGTLFREAFGTERPPDVWRWKYFGSRPSVGYVCEVEGRLVAHCGGIPVRMREGGSEFDALQSVDFMSSPTYAGGMGGGGVFVRTVRRMFEERCGTDKVQMVYGFPGERHRLVGERLLGYRALEPVHELTLGPTGDTETTETLTAALLREFMPVSVPGVAAIRDEAYLRWRYVEHPQFTYSVVRIRSGWPIRRSAAALIRSSADELLLMELAGSPGPKVFAALIQRLARVGKPVKTWMSPYHAIGISLLNTGFVATPRDHSLEYRFFSDHASLTPGSVYYTLGDYDVH